MLQPGVIPSAEPVIRVGIILPEDSQKEITLSIPKSGSFLLEDSARENAKAPSGSINFKNSDTGIHCSHLNRTSSHWRLIPEDNSHIAPQSGILVKNVVAGRGFHWQKFIDTRHH